ncbi:SMI1/KNR4 family protein [Priestia megaterium]|uniref:SMI1/KNR4 family protein n=1 Tax=Priestia megaterium TaxID=1404 RepID=UPI00211D0866|nr:SMI1/KNR4 family protein [Priestia megaterium]
MKQLWNEFEQWLELNYLKDEDIFNAAATEIEIAQAENIMGLKFPESFKDILLMHNGQKSERVGVIGNYDFLSIDEIVHGWQVMRELFDGGEFEDFEEVEPVGPVKGEFWWNPLWIPIVTNTTGDYICIDLDPSEGGKVGQIITFWHDWEEREVISDSLEKWFQKIVTHLKNGTYKLVKEDGELMFNNYGFIEE